MTTRETRKPRVFTPRHLRARRRWALVAALLSALSQAHAEPFGLELRGDNGDWQPGLAMDTAVDMQIHGLMAEVSVRQRFQNDSKDWQEGRYLLPLPGDAAVGRLRIHVGDRVIEGEVQEKKQAAATYQQAAASGQRAALVEQTRANLFKTAVANIGPGETVEVEIGYWQSVTYREGEFSLSLPLTITPRYRAEGSPLDAPISEAQKAAAAVSVDPDGFEPSMSLHVALEPGVVLREVVSPSHRIDVDSRDDHYDIRLHNWAEASDRDFVLNWKPAPSAEPQRALFTEEVEGERFALLMLLPPTQPVAAVPRELIVVVDQSGSMQGGSIEQAKAAVDTALTRLRPDDRFNLIRFNDRSDSFLPASVPASAENITLARAWVAALEANGGTEMSGAIHAALSSTPVSGYLRQVVLVTDAAIGNENQLLAEIEQERGDARVFTVGIGSAPNEWFVRRSSELGRGSHELVRDISQVAPRMTALLNRIDRPLLRSLDVQWPSAAEAYPQRIPDLYAGEPLQMVAKVSDFDGMVRARGITRESQWKDGLALGLGKRGGSRGVARLWARAKLEALEDEERHGGDAAAIRSESVGLAIRHQLVSRFTSLVAVDHTPVRPDVADLRSTRIANAAPAGSVAMAAGATSARSLVGLGIALLLLMAALARREPASTPGLA